MEEFKVRRAIEQDVSSVFALVSQLDKHQLNSEILKNKFFKNLFDMSVEYWLLEINGVDIGFISIHANNFLHHDKVVYEIAEVVIDHEYRGKGYGSKLVASIMKRYPERWFELSSKKTRRKIKEFYEGLGFECSHNKYVFKGERMV